MTDQQSPSLNHIKFHFQTSNIYSKSISSMSLIQFQFIILGTNDGLLNMLSLKPPYSSFEYIFSNLKAHQNYIHSISENLSDKNILITSDPSNIKIWFFNTQLKTLIKLKSISPTTTTQLNHLFSIYNNHFITTSWDNIISIWNLEYLYREHYTFKANGKITSIIQLHKRTKDFSEKENEIIIYGCLEPKQHIAFLDIKKYVQIPKSINGICPTHKGGLLEISNEHVAVVSKGELAIYIVDVIKCTKVKEIKHTSFEYYHSKELSLLELSLNKLLYVYENEMCIIDTNSYEIIQQETVEKNSGMKVGVIKCNQFLICDNSTIQGLNVYLLE